MVENPNRPTAQRGGTAERGGEGSVGGGCGAAPRPPSVCGRFILLLLMGDINVRGRAEFFLPVSHHDSQNDSGCDDDVTELFNQYLVTGPK